MVTETAKRVNFGGLDLDPVELGINGNAILGIKESGKSYLGTELGEIFFDSNIPFIAFDPIGVWHNMRYPGRGKGYPIVVAGGFHGDMPLKPETAPMIVEAAMKNRVSLVLDLFHPSLSKREWRAIVKTCALLLLHNNSMHGLRHVFIEEAAEFVPQRPIDYEVYESIERLIRMGGNSRLGCTLISPRSQEVNKAVLELCENMFLFRQRGKNALENLKKWLDIAGAAGADVMRTLPTMPRGECWAWLGGSDTPVHLKVPPKRSFHPDRRSQHGEVAPSGKAVPVDRFVAALQKTLPRLEEEAIANDPTKLRAALAKATKELDAAKRTSTSIPAYPDRSEEVSMLNGALIRVQEQRDVLQRQIAAAATALGLDPPIFDNDKVNPVVKFVPTPERASPVVDGPNFASRAVYIPKAPAVAPSEGNGAVPSGCAKPLAVLAGAYPGGMTEGQWATAAGYKRTGGTWKEYRSRLTRAGMIEKADGRYFATEFGANSAGPVETPPAPGPALARWWRPRISVPERVVEILIEAWPRAIPKDELADRLEMTATGGSFKEYLSRLRRNEIALVTSEGVRLTDAVMGG